ncbi:MAG: VIT1/CCC1 transporter family protein [Actinomycetota bacterium]
MGSRSGALRAAIFGVNDGLVSNLALIMGVAGAGVDREVILLAGIAGLLAGAFSMAAGEYASMRVQRELFERLLHIEAHEIGTDPEGETEELAILLERKGMPSPVARAAAESLMTEPTTALEIHAKEELGLDPDALGSPIAAAGSSFTTFAGGALLPITPYFLTGGPVAAIAAGALALAALGGVGAVMSRFTDRGAVFSGLRMILLGGSAALVTYLVGRLLGGIALG